MSPDDLRGWRQFMALGDYYHRLACEWRDGEVSLHSWRIAQIASGRAYMQARFLRDGWAS